jgi:hypothetical protein
VRKGKIAFNHLNSGCGRFWFKI